MIRARLPLLSLLLLLAPLAPTPLHALTPTAAWTLEGGVASRHLGEYQSTAGDVNNDGYSDVLIGEPNYTNGQSGEGRARLYLGGPNGLAATPAWEVESNIAGYAFGRCVAPAGDVNADGYGDWLVGVTGYDNGQNNEGAVHVYLGGAGALGTTPVAILEGNSTSTLFGHAAGTAGDVNGDGFNDIVVGAYIYSNGQTQEGRAYLYLGNSGGVSTTPAWTFEGDQTAAHLGFSVSTAGDLNGDGFADVAIGAYSYDATALEEGRVFIFHGNAAPGLPAAPSFQVGLGSASAAYGYAVSTAGDLNGDGYADLVVGARNYGNGQATEGAFHVLLGGTNGVNGTMHLLVESNVVQANLGGAVATAGDMNGDGFADIVAAAPAYSANGLTGGIVIVRYGAGSVPSGMAVQADTLAGDAAGQNFGFAVATAGDVNGDGFSDLLVGSNNFTNGQSQEGRVQLFLGGATLPRNTFTTGTAMFPGANELLVAPVGDMNGDGKADMAIGVADLTSGGNLLAGELHVWETFPSGSNTKLVGGVGVSEKLGTSISGIYDVNGDGLSDLAVGAPGWRAGNLALGRVLVYGGSTSALGTLLADIPGSQAGAQFGQAVALTGDVNADGYADLLVGSPQYDNGTVGGGRQAGRVDLYLGGPGGMNTLSDWHVEGTGHVRALGVSLACAGDVNGDGFTDAAITRFNVSTGRNEVILYHGAPSPTLLAPAEVVAGSHASFATRASAPAGDLNGDGFSDFLVSAPTEPSTPGGQGRVYGYFGSEAGLVTTPGWMAEAAAGITHFGDWVASAGDMNADGLTEVVVGGSLMAAGASSDSYLYLYNGRPAGPASTPDYTSVRAALSAYRSSVGVGDVDGDGLADVATAVHSLTTNSRSLLFFCGAGDHLGRSRRPQLTEFNDAAPRAPLNQPDLPTSIGLTSLLASPAGRELAAVEKQVRRFRLPMDGNYVTSQFLPLPPPGAAPGAALLTVFNEVGLQPGTAYRYGLRHRYKSPYFLHSIRFANPLFGAAEMQFRMPGAVAGLPDGERPARPALLGAPTPNPARDGTTFELSLPAPGRVEVALFDVQGRLVRRLVDDLQSAGPRTLRWDGRNDAGQAVGAGIYFVKLRSPFGEESRRVTVVR